MGYYLGGFTVTNTGWLSQSSCYCDFVSTLGSGYLWQLYANRRLIGRTIGFGERRVIGNLAPSLSPTPLTVVCVDATDQFTDFGALLPLPYCTQWDLTWISSGSALVDHWAIVMADSAGGALDTTNVIANIPFTGDGTYSFALDPFVVGPSWTVAVVPVDAAGNEGTPVSGTILCPMPPKDITAGKKARFAAATSGANLIVNFQY